MACEVNNKEINSQCAELLVRPTSSYEWFPFKELVPIKRVVEYCLMLSEGNKIDDVVIHSIIFDFSCIFFKIII